MSDDKIKADADAKAKADAETKAKADAEKKAKDEAASPRPKVKFFPGGSPRGVGAEIVSRARNDVNVAELEIRDGANMKRVESVPKWNGKGDQPGFDVWTE